MVDEGRVLRLLRAITDDIAVLSRESAADEQRRQDPMWLRGVKYTFVTAIEACVDVAQHICAAQGWGPPADNGDAVRLLGEHGVLTRRLAASIRKAVGFRNVLVHEYVEVDNAVVVDRLGDLSDLENFVSEVAAYVTRQEGAQLWRARLLRSPDRTDGESRDGERRWRPRAGAGGGGTRGVRVAGDAVDGAVHGGA
jgi:uncharacterized protein YutE (UPF0331/DUF86 family)